MVWEGNNVVAACISLFGLTNPLDCLPGTVRADYAIEKSRNVVHCSEKVESAIREINIWFKSEEIINWNICDNRLIFEKI